MTERDVPPGGSGERSRLDVELDVVICGGGLAGLTLARQLRQTLPGLSVAVVERTARPLPEACHKVGESSVELGSCYLEQLGLREYLLEHHLVKFGLRFFPGGGQLPFDQRAELGPSQEPLVNSYQIDRGQLESHLRAGVESDGVLLLEGARVDAVHIGREGLPHRVDVVEIDGARPRAPRSLSARWLVDATGRQSLLRRQLGLSQSTRHVANAGWFRLEGRVDITRLVPVTERSRPWFTQPHADKRWRSTNHLMGEGYWVWIIPLPSGRTSIGLVTSDEHHGFREVRSLERCRAFLRTHEPHLAKALDPHRVLDFHCLRGYSHQASHYWSSDRWALVGEAGAFVDPLYSPGTDFIGVANSLTTQLIATDAAGGDLPLRVAEASEQYDALIASSMDLFRDAAPVYGHARAMAAKIYWDNFCYWAFPCQYFLQEMYRQTGYGHARLMAIGTRYAHLSRIIQAVIQAWARSAPEAPTASRNGP